MNDEQIINYCRRLAISNLKAQQQDFTEEIASILASEEVLLEHCYGIRDLMDECIKILEKEKDND